MNRQIFIPALLALIFVAPSMAEEIYKWEDESGQMHYSDVPHDGADEVEILPIQTFSAPPVATNSDSSTDEVEADAEEEEGYDSLAITSPRMEETIWNTGGNVSVNVSLQPGLRIGHRITLFLDGQELGQMPRGASMLALTEVPRGSHVLSATVTNQDGKALAQSEPVTFFYQQTAVQRLKKSPR